MHYERAIVKTSTRRPPVHVEDAGSLQTFLDFTLSEESPERELPCVLFEIKHHSFASPVILFNCEQLSRATVIERVVKLAANPNVKEVWDYSTENCRLLGERGIVARHVPLVSPKAYVEQVRGFRRPPLFDVGFCGAPSARRVHIVNELIKAGVTVYYVTNFGEERDKRLACCKIVLNIHHSDDYKIFEQARCDVWLRAGVPVVSETSLDDDERCINTPYDSLVATVKSALLSLNAAGLHCSTTMPTPFFQKIYVINLDHRTDRLSGFMKNMEEVGLVHLVERVPATYVKEFGTLGNAMSCVEVLTRIAASDHTHSMFCEDDFRFKSKSDALEWLARMEETIKTLDYDVISLSGNHTVPDFRVESTAHSHLRRVKCLQALSCFIVHKSFAPTLLASMTESKVNLEKFRDVSKYAMDQYLKRLQPRCKWFLSNPILGLQEASHSDLENKFVSYGC